MWTVQARGRLPPPSPEKDVQFQAAKQSSAATLRLLLLLLLLLRRLCCACLAMSLLLGPHGGVQASTPQQQLVVSEQRREGQSQSSRRTRSGDPDLSAELQGKHRWQDDEHVLDVNNNLVPDLARRAGWEKHLSRSVSSEK